MNDRSDSAAARTTMQKADAHMRRGELDQARSAYAEACRIDPCNARAWLMLGNINAQSGLAAEAQASYREAIDRDPQLGEAYQYLGNSLGSQGRYEEAVACYRGALRIKPHSIPAHVNLGATLVRQGSLEEALQVYGRALRFDPECHEASAGLAQVQYRLGKAKSMRGRIDEALAHYRAALKQRLHDPDLLKNLGDAFLELQHLDQAAECYQALLEEAPSAYAHYCLGNVHTERQRFDHAAHHYRQALRLEPDRAEIHNNLGNALRYLRQYPQAETAYRRALELRPDHPMSHEGHANLGTVLLLMGRLDEAAGCFRRALELRPDFQRAVAGLADVLEKRGDFEQAYEQIRRSLEASPVDANVAVVFAAVCRPLGRCGEAIALLETALVDARDLFERKTLHFTLGHLLDAAQEYDKAFVHYQQANRLAQPYAEKEHSAYIHSVMSTYSAEFMAGAPQAANRSHLPVFIVGMPRSGTSLVEQIMASHPQVFAAGELDEIHHLAANLEDSLGMEGAHVERLTPVDCDRLAQRYLDRLDSLHPPDVRRVTDKMPSNFLHLGLISMIFPEARIIHCVRDALDTCLSCYFQDFVTLSYSYDLAHLGEYYRQYRRLMAHWRNVVHLPVMEVRYEDLVADQVGVSRAMVEFCGLDWDERCLRFHETKRVVATASHDQVRRPIYSSSVGRWRHYAKHLAPLKRALGRVDDRD